MNSLSSIRLNSFLILALIVTTHFTQPPTTHHHRRLNHSLRLLLPSQRANLPHHRPQHRQHRCRNSSPPRALLPQDPTRHRHHRHHLPLLLTSLASIRAAAKAINDRSIPHIDILIHNAGIMACPMKGRKVDWNLNGRRIPCLISYSLTSFSPNSSSPPTHE